jgi:hypothetical protein
VSSETIDKPKAVVVTKDDVTIPQMETISANDTKARITPTPVEPVRVPDIRYDFSRAASQERPEPDLASDLKKNPDEPPPLTRRQVQDILNEKLPAGAKVFYTNPNAPKVQPDWPEVQELSELGQKKLIQNGVLSPEDEERRDMAIESLAARTNTDKSTVEQYLKMTDTASKKVDEANNPLNMPTNPEAESEIERLLKMKARGSITPDQELDLQEKMKAYAHDQGMNMQDMRAIEQDFIKYQKLNDKDPQIDPKSLSDVINTINSAAALAHAEDKVVFLPGSTSFYDKFDLNSPLTNEQHELMTGLHEYGHIHHPKGNNFQNPALNRLEAEIAGDRHAIKEAPDLRDQYMRWRNVQAVSMGDIIHDTKPYIDNPNADMSQLYAERKTFFDRIEKQTGIEHNENTKPEDVGGALLDILKRDAEDPKYPKLSENERKWAQEYLRDIKALGYEPNPNYERAPDNTNTPVLAQPSITVPSNPIKPS